MELIKANEADTSYCAALSIDNMTTYYKRWGEPVLDETAWRKVTAGCEFYLVVKDGVRVGFISVEIDPSDPKALFLVEIQMENGHRGEGALKAVRPDIRKIMRDKGLTAITGSVHRDNPLITFYEAIGYRKTSITPTRYNIRKDFSEAELQSI